MIPKRIKLERTKGWRMPEGVVKCDRSTRWGNPFVIGPNMSREESLEKFEVLARSWDLAELRGQDLGCWCKPEEACHADILLRLANRKVPSGPYLDSVRKEQVCPACGVREPMPALPMEMGKMIAWLNRFIKGHKHCGRAVALSLRQPWAWLMIRPDIVGEAERAAAYAGRLIKDVENREWRANVRGRVLVHASGTMTKGDYETAQIHANALEIELPPAKELLRGGIVGEFTITDCVEEHESPWFFGRYGFTVKDARPLPFVACGGMQRWFYPDLTETAA